MLISEVAEKTGLSSKSIRLYEQKKIISAPLRNDAGYRIYQHKHLEQLQLIANAKKMGFGLEQCKQLITLAENPDRASREVKQHAIDKLNQIRAQIEQWQSMADTLSSWVEQCPGDDQSQCPIIERMASAPVDKT
ncbi:MULTISPECIES: Cu(I)-responsive transcriptional regulator [unclassified Vibrio]|uniref:HTH-type transcriptional regulator CueR n=1 Tax=Vibrio sp. HB236076 TaxID=3232307 RepID=A0AB39HHD8_9VIBR|nr:Cu(I)-responsive transcriptional regulator [Vibrio sp. HB161653]MDP5252848.1 Cu(I)-responsive transcriptional regulator [Vibrio sp. HB161653]